MINNSKMPNNTINEKNGSKIRLQQLATIVREYLALRLSEMLLKYSRYHGQEDLRLAISKATDLLHKMKFKKLKQSRIDDYYC